MKRSLISVAVQVALFAAVYPVRKDGETVQAGDLVELTNQEAAPLLARQIVKPASAEEQRAWSEAISQTIGDQGQSANAAQQPGSESGALEPDRDPTPSQQPTWAPVATADAPAVPTTSKLSKETTKQEKKA